MEPPLPATTIVPLPIAMPSRSRVTPALRFVQSVVFGDERIVPFSPTATNTPLANVTPSSRLGVPVFSRRQLVLFPALVIRPRVPPSTNRPFPRSEEHT